MTTGVPERASTATIMGRDVLKRGPNGPPRAWRACGEPSERSGTARGVRQSCYGLEEVEAGIALVDAAGDLLRPFGERRSQPGRTLSRKRACRRVVLNVTES